MKLHQFLLSAAALGICMASQAAEPVLAEAQGRVQVTTGDVQGDALRIPAEIRGQALAKPEAVQQLANNLVIRRALAAQAEADGMGKDPAIQGAIRVARDKVLSEVLLMKLDAQNKPDPKAVEALARTTYNANPQRFHMGEQVEVSHILLKKDEPGAQQKANLLLSQIRSGAPFAEVAKQHSQDSTAARGGLIGPLSPGQTVPEFEQAYTKLADGQISPVVETRFGFHIIRVERRVPAGVRSFDEVKTALMQETEEKILTEKRMDYIKQIQATVKHDNAAIEAFTKTAK